MSIAATILVVRHFRIKIIDFASVGDIVALVPSQYQLKWIKLQLYTTVMKVAVRKGRYLDSLVSQPLPSALQLLCKIAQQQ